MTAPNTSSPERAILGAKSPRIVFFGVALTVFVLSTFFALTQSPRTDPFQPVVALSHDWWRYPVETNAYRRLPAFSGCLRRVFASRDGRSVWAVGEGGIIIYSEDDGRSWVQQATPLSIPMQRPAGAKRSSFEFPSPIAERFGPLAPTSQQLRAFRRLSDGIRVS